MENVPFPIKTSTYKGFSMAMLNNQNGTCFKGSLDLEHIVFCPNEAVS